MKLRRILVENVRSFLEAQELNISDNISILIGPNGGGKTNLLDTISIALRLHLLKSWVPRLNPGPDQSKRYDWIPNGAVNARLLEKHSRGASRPQRIELDIELSTSDLSNITKAKEEAIQVVEKAKARGLYTGYPIEQASSWDITQLSVGQVFIYRIVNNSLQPNESQGAKTFLEYLNLFEIYTRIRSDLELEVLSTPMISLPVNRSIGGLQVSVSLANFNEYEQKRLVDAASSRSQGSIISLAIGQLASHYRSLIERDNGNARKTFYSNPQVKEFTTILESLGYEWKLECINRNTNEYSIRLEKQGASFFVDKASSGEKELLIYMFAIYALNIRDALILIDEPEMHLHPRWQRLLLDLFDNLSLKSGNQFIMATHSPTFVSPSSIQYVSRIHSDQQCSKITKLSDSSLPNAKHLLNIVNSQNNERLFFADRVILVEGVSDRILFEALSNQMKAEQKTDIIIEFVEVGGKGLFAPYETLLKACKIPYFLIADLDYVNQIGTPDIKTLFKIQWGDVATNVIDNPKSIDAGNLLSRLDNAIISGNVDDLKALWKYIKSRQRRLRKDLTDSERTLLNAFLIDKQKESIFILTKGAIEEYLPNGLKSKDLGKLIEFVSTENLWERIELTGKAELEGIVKAFIS
jgi:predicted ATPase